MARLYISDPAMPTLWEFLLHVIYDANKTEATPQRHTNGSTIIYSFAQYESVSSDGQWNCRIAHILYIFASQRAVMVQESFTVCSKSQTLRYLDRTSSEPASVMEFGFKITIIAWHTCVAARSMRPSFFLMMPHRQTALVPEDK